MFCLGIFPEKLGGGVWPTSQNLPYHNYRHDLAKNLIPHVMLKAIFMLLHIMLLLGTG